MCRSYDYIGSRRDGGFAELVAVPVWNLIELKPGVSMAAGAMLEPLAVALHAVKRAGPLEGRSVCVVGTGVIALAAACWARIRGAARVQVAGRNESKRALAERLGGVDYCTGVQAKESDVVIEAVGTPESLQTALALAAPEGRVVLAGNPAGDMGLTQDAYWKILRNQIHISGTWNSRYESGTPSDWTEVMDAVAGGQIPAEALITHRFDQRQLPEGLRLMREHREPYCKVMTVWNQEAGRGV